MDTSPEHKASATPSGRAGHGREGELPVPHSKRRREAGNGRHSFPKVALTVDLPIGTRFYEWVGNREVECTILGDVEPWTDRFGRDLHKRLARREDTGRTGYIFFGPQGVLRVQQEEGEKT